MEGLMNKIEELISKQIERFVDKIVEKYDDLEKDTLLSLWNGKVSTKSEKKEKPDKKETKKSSSVSSVAQSGENPEGKCNYILTKGARKGDFCSLKRKDGSKFCSTHKKHEGTEPKEKKVLPEPLDSSRIFRKNSQGYLCDSTTGFVIKSKDEQIVIGKFVDEKLEKLTKDDIKTCQKLKLKFDIDLDSDSDEEEDKNKEDKKKVEPEVVSSPETEDESEKKKEVEKKKETEKKAEKVEKKKEVEKVEKKVEKVETEKKKEKVETRKKVSSKSEEENSTEKELSIEENDLPTKEVQKAVQKAIGLDGDEFEFDE